MMFGSILVLFVLPWLDTSRGAQRAVPADLPAVDLAAGWSAVILLGVCGAHKPEGIWVVLSRVCTLYYFLHFLVILPVLGKLERPLPLPDSISRPVLRRRRRPAARRAPRPSRWRRRDARALVRRLPAACCSLAAVRLATPAVGAGRSADTAAAAVELRGAVRHLRPRRRAARLPGLFRGLLGLPLDEASCTTATWPASA